MLDIKAVNHVGIRIGDRARSLEFYEVLGFKLERDAGFDDGHPLILRHPSGVVLNLLGPATEDSTRNILMDVPEKFAGITHFALTVASLAAARDSLETAGIEITGSFSIEGMSAIFVRDPDRTVIELDAYEEGRGDSSGGYSSHPE
jgi:lactoylglutathione lyase